MRIDVRKFLFFGFRINKEAFFKRAQELGIIHFIAMDSGVKTVPLDLTELIAALRVLRGLPPTGQEEIEDYSLADGIAEKIVALKNKLDGLAEDQRILRLEIARIDIFGDFKVEDLDFIKKEGNKTLQFFYAKKDLYDDANLPEEVIFIGTEQNLDYFVAINDQPKQYHRMVEMLIDQPVGVLRSRYQANQKEILATEHQLKTYSKYKQFLHQALVYEMDRHNLNSTQNSVQNEMDGELFAIEGWVPVNKIAAMQQLADEQDIHVEEIEVETKDVIPTYLENEGFHRIGEDLINIYDTPSHTDKDPSPWVLFFFSLFFAMILGDAGYGLVFLATALYFRYRMGAFKGLGNRVWKLFVILSAACIFWGTMAHSFFGIQLSPNNPLRKISLLQWLETKKADYYFQQQGTTYQEWLKAYPKIAEATSGEEVLNYGVKIKNGQGQYEIASDLADGILLEIALLVGIIHLSFSFLRNLDRNWSGIGWILFMFGCYLYFPSYLKAETMVNYVFGVSVAKAAESGKILIYLGLGLAFLLGILKDKIWGLLQLMNLIQVFGDVLSYLRLYALGLAGSVVMATVNDFASTLNIVFGMLLLVIGHFINIILGIMGGVIHGLRLNFIEWYHYSFEGNGRKFNPLRKTLEND